MQEIQNIFSQFAGVLFNLESRLALGYLAATVLMAYVIWRVRGRQKSFFSWLVPKEVYLHKSNLVDFKIFVFNFLMGAGGVFAAVTITPAVTIFLLNLLGMPIGGDTLTDSAAPTVFQIVAATLIMILTMDFCTYWAHRLHHETRVLWPFHSVHHSAEIMTPLTVTRKHPVYVIIRSLIYSFIVGAAQALMLFLLMDKIDIYTIGTANVGYFLFNAFGANLRHSHIWLSYGPMVEHILISPAQHHIHHSKDTKHHNKNYGEVFAIWDLMFGSLYVIRHYEDLTFGLADETGQLIEQPHPTLRAALINPFIESWEALWAGTSRDPVEPRSSDASETQGAG